MTTTATQAQSAITPKALQKKWGATIIAAGYTAVPDILLRRMGALRAMGSGLAFCLPAWDDETLGDRM